jgi:hypothetical protein
MPQLLTDGLPPRTNRTKYDFSEWADGRAWRFEKGTDYVSSTETFRSTLRKWAKANRLEVEIRPFPALDADGQELPLTTADAVALGVRFLTADNGSDARLR